MIELADIFCELYDELDVGIYRQRCDKWLGDALLDSKALSFSEMALRNGLPGWVIVDYLNDAADADDLQFRRFAVLRGLDRAFAELNPLLASNDPSLAHLAVDRATVVARGRLDSGARPGALICRVTGREHRKESDHPREAFAAVLRVQDDAYDRCEFKVLPSAVKMSRREFENGIKYGCAPFVEDPDEMHFETGDRHGRRVYRIGPAGLPATSDRIDAILTAFIDSDVQIGVIPELTLSSDLLKAWQDALQARAGATGALELLMVGTGDLDGGSRPKNTAVLLHARTGEELARQDKMYPFDLDSAQLKLWKLESRLGDVPIEEDLDPGLRLSVLDLGAARLSVLVCEDLARVLDNGLHIRSFGVSHLIVPVFARATKDRRWERDRAMVHCESTGSTAIVANSRVMHQIDGEPADSGTAIAAWPGNAVLKRASEASEVVCFLVGPDGSVS